MTNLYHGSSNPNIERFHPSSNDGKISTIFGSEKVKRHGIFLTPNKEIASGYAGTTGRVYRTTASIKNPFDMRNGVSERMEQDFVKAGGNTRWLYNDQETWEKFDGDAGQHFVDTLKKAGYDGVIFHETSPHNGQKHETHVAFDSNQIHIHEESIMKTLSQFLIESKVGDYVSIDADVPGEIHQAVKQLKFSVDPIPKEESHATLIYSVGTMADHDLIQKRLNKHALPIMGTVAGLTKFDALPKDGQHAADKCTIVMEIESPELHAIHKELKTLGLGHSYPDYRPHVSLVYDVPKDEAEQKMGQLTDLVKNQKIMFNKFNVTRLK